MEFKRVRKQGEQKVVTIPKKSEIEVNDLVKIEKVVERCQ
jgi:hypothetical protein